MKHKISFIFLVIFLTACKVEQISQTLPTETRMVLASPSVSPSPTSLPPTLTPSPSPSHTPSPIPIPTPTLTIVPTNHQLSDAKNSLPKAPCNTLTVLFKSKIKIFIRSTQMVRNKVILYILRMNFGLIKIQPGLLMAQGWLIKREQVRDRHQAVYG